MDIAAPVRPKWRLKWRKEVLRVILAMAMIIVGTTHFIRPDQFAKIIPPIFAFPYSLVYISGVFEILGGIGLLIPWISVAAAIGLIALFIAVFPANLYQTFNAIPIDGIPHYPILYWFRLPFQAVFIAWAWWYIQAPEDQPGADWLADRFKAWFNF